MFIRRTADGLLWRAVFDPAQGTWGAFSSMGTALRSGPAAASWGSGRLDVIAFGSNGALQQNSANQGTWYGFHPITLGGTVPTIATTGLPDGVTGQSYAAQLATSDGRAGTWTLASGALPSGLTLTPSGEISGVPSAAGVSTFGVKFTDTVARAATRTLTISIAAGQ
jgi:hypothetical protein